MEIKAFPVPENIDVEQFPNTAKYIMLHGMHNTMSKWDLKAPYRTMEEVYAKCLELGVTWEDLLDFKGYDKNTLL